MTLSKFSTTYFEAYDQVCECLDTKRGRGHYVNVAKHFKVAATTITSRFENHPEGPSKALIEWLAGEEPDLTVNYFAHVLMSKGIRRKDVVEEFRKAKVANQRGGPLA